MAKNENLHKAKDAKKDEFYTQYEDIQNELNHYEQHFKGKTVLCNCDDPFESNFCKFFLRNFNYLGLKRLICTSYSTSPVIGQQLTLFDWMDEPVVRGNGYVMDIREVPMANGRGVSDADIDALLKSKKRGVKKLKGDGDFRSEECIEYLKQADIVVTNPPFIEAPLFAEKNLMLQSNAIAAEMYEKIMTPGYRCIVDYIIGKTDFRVKFTRHGDTMSFIHTAEDVDEQELAPLPHMLKALRTTAKSDIE